MRLELPVLAFAWACALPPGSEQKLASPKATSLTTADSLTAADRARIIEALASFREAVFQPDTTRLDGCSVAAVVGVGMSYRQLVQPSFRYRIQDPITGSCVPEPNYSGSRVRLVLRSIVSDGKEATVEASFLGSSYTHHETYKLRQDEYRGRRNWIPLEVRIFSLVISD